MPRGWFHHPLLSSVQDSQAFLHVFLVRSPTNTSEVWRAKCDGVLRQWEQQVNVLVHQPWVTGTQWQETLGTHLHTQLIQEWLRRASPSYSFCLHVSPTSLILLHQRQLFVYFCN